MKVWRASTALLLGIAAGLLTGGCAQSSDMSSKEAADFKGAPHQPMTDAKKKAMNDFMENFRKTHPEQGGGDPTTK